VHLVGFTIDIYRDAWPYNIKSYVTVCGFSRWRFSCDIQYYYWSFLWFSSRLHV